MLPPFEIFRMPRENESRENSFDVSDFRLLLVVVVAVGTATPITPMQCAKRTIFMATTQCLLRKKTKSLISINHNLNYSMRCNCSFGQLASVSVDTNYNHLPPPPFHVAKTQFVNFNSKSVFFFFAETEEGAAQAPTDASADALPANDIQSSGSATPSPNSDNDRQHIDDRMPRIKSIDSLRQMQEIDVERNIPAAYIQDTNNVNVDR